MHLFTAWSENGFHVKPAFALRDYNPCAFRLVLSRGEDKIVTRKKNIAKQKYIEKEHNPSYTDKLRINSFTYLTRDVFFDETGAVVNKISSCFSNHPSH